MRYVLGFAFDDLHRVALIKKLRPQWQAGRFNGIGGKVEGDEDPIVAMSREFRGETGVLVPVTEWTFRGMMQGLDWEVLIYMTRSQLVRNVRTETDEHVYLMPVWSLRSVQDELIENVSALIALCLIPATPPSMVSPLFALNYGAE